MSRDGVGVEERPIVVAECGGAATLTRKVRIGQFFGSRSETKRHKPAADRTAQIGLEFQRFEVPVVLDRTNSNSEELRFWTPTVLNLVDTLGIGKTS